MRSSGRSSGRFPENRILSHDLLEGCYARAGLLSDVQFYEEYPSRYSADASRVHRWIRGDWQIARWLLPCVPGLGDKYRKNPLSGLSRWKIFDNLRRSLVPPGLTILLALGWTVLNPAWLWTLSAIGIILIPPAIAAIAEFLRTPEDTPLGQHFASTADSLGRRLFQAVFTLACLPYEAWSNLDAIVRTSGRMLVHAKTPSGMEYFGGREYECRRRPSFKLPIDVDRPGARLRRLRSIWLISRPVALAVAAPILVPVVCFSRHRLVDQPAARAQGSKPDRRPDRVSAEHFPQDLGVLRDVRRRGR